MKIFQIISAFIFISGFLLKLFHLPGNQILIAGTSLILISGFIRFLTLLKKNIALGFLHLTISLWTVHFLFRFMFWRGGPGLLGIPFILLLPIALSAVTIALHIYKKTPFRRLQIIGGIALIISIFIASSPASSVFYFIHLNPVTHSRSSLADFRGWDKYSWFLYIRGDVDGAIAANQKAKNALEYTRVNDESDYHIVYLDIINEHEFAIKSRSWNRYYWLR